MSVILQRRGVKPGQLMETVVDRKRFWALVSIIIFSLVLTVFFYVGIMDDWKTPRPKATLALGSVIIFFLSSPVPLIWWAVRRFEYKRSVGPLVLWMVAIITLIVSDFLTAPARGW